MVSDLATQIEQASEGSFELSEAFLLAYGAVKVPDDAGDPCPPDWLLPNGQRENSMFDPTRSIDDAMGLVDLPISLSTFDDGSVEVSLERGEKFYPGNVMRGTHAIPRAICATVLRANEGVET